MRLSQVRFPPKLIWYEIFHRNFIRFNCVYSFDSKDHVKKNLIGTKSSKILLNQKRPKYFEIYTSIKKVAEND